MQSDSSCLVFQGSNLPQCNPGRALTGGMISARPQAFLHFLVFCTLFWVLMDKELFIIHQRGREIGESG